MNRWLVGWFSDIEKEGRECGKVFFSNDCMGKEGFCLVPSLHLNCAFISVFMFTITFSYLHFLLLHFLLLLVASLFPVSEFSSYLSPKTYWHDIPQSSVPKSGINTKYIHDKRGRRLWHRTTDICYTGGFGGSERKGEKEGGLNCVFIL